MDVGDLIEWQETRLFVRKLMPDTQMVLAVAADGSIKGLAMEDCRVVCSPVTQWPFVVVKTKKPIVSLERHYLTRRSEVYAPLVDYVQPEPRQSGSIFFNPELKLAFGVVLTAKLEDGSMARIDIPQNFGTAAQKVARTRQPEQPEEWTAYDRLLGNDFDE